MQEDNSGKSWGEQFGLYLEEKQVKTTDFDNLDEM